MGEDASLDDFLDGESSEQSEAAESTSDATAETVSGDEAESTTDAATERADTAAADTDIEPATTTYAWDGAGGVCEGCGETVERRWQQDSGLVCIECKDWERA